MKTNLSVFIIGAGKLPKKARDYTTAELNALWKQEIIEKFPLEDFIKRINTRIMDGLDKATVIVRFENPRKVICLKCGNTDVLCEGWINPGRQSLTGALDHYSDESFLYGRCNACGKGEVLTDVSQVQDDIDLAYKRFTAENRCEPVTALCEITFHGDLTTDTVNIKLTEQVEESDDDDYFFYCNGVNELKKLCDRTSEDFVVTRIDAFYKE